MSGRLKIILFSSVLITILGMVYMEMKGRDSLHLVQVPWSYKIKKVKPQLPSINSTSNTETATSISTTESGVNNPSESSKEEQERYIESFSEIRQKEIEQNRQDEIRSDKVLIEQRAPEFPQVEQPSP